MGWEAWRLDLFTWLWIVWIVYFAVVEAASLMLGNDQELTKHLRPFFNQFDLAWFLAVGLWLWVGWHFLIDGVDFAEVFNVGVR